MQQLTGLGAIWPYLETPTTPLHVGVLNVFETLEGDGRGVGRSWAAAQA